MDNMVRLEVVEVVQCLQEWTSDVCGGKVKETLDQEDVLVVSLILSLEIALTVHVLRSSSSCLYW